MPVCFMQVVVLEIAYKIVQPGECSNYSTKRPPSTLLEVRELAFPASGYTQWHAERKS